MNIRTAILKAADSIEQNPNNYDFTSTEIPSCGTAGCVIGWVAYHLGMRDECWRGIGRDDPRSIKIIGMEEGAFYRRMDDFADEWMSSAPDCAQALRKYADKYHPAQGMPDVVRSWFDEKAVA